MMFDLIMDLLTAGDQREKERPTAGLSGWVLTGCALRIWPQNSTKPREVRFMSKLMDALIDAAELLDWSVHIYDDYIEFEKYSPAGEDFIFTITGNDEARVVEQVREYAYDFDPDEHAEMWVESRGKRGVPDSIRTLIDDADAIKEMVSELADALRKAEEEYQKEAAG